MSSHHQGLIDDELNTVAGGCELTEDELSLISGGTETSFLNDLHCHIHPN
jgi:bacteriocin-like protein